MSTTVQPSAKRWMGPLRYSSKKHRITALDMRSSHHNEVGKTRSVKRLLDRGLHVEKLLVESMNKLTEIREKHNFTIEYLTEQWLRQRQCQLEAMETESEREMIKLVGDLVNLEDELQDAQDEIELLRAKRRRTRTQEEQERLELLPNTVTSLEEQIEILVDELGSEAFRNLPGASDAQSKALIRLKISKSKLYEAKVGVCEVQRRWDQRGSGTRMQARFKKLMSSKMKHLKSKWTSYNQKALNYNENHSTNISVATPVFEDVRSMGLDDPFWNMGSLSHPNEPWAINSTIKEGIEAILMSTHCNDELHRISREARQAIKWAVEKFKCLDIISKLLHRDQQTNIENPHGQDLLIDICTKNNFPREVLESVYCNLA
ncbi:uncharacterized protein PGTG_05397 [Puccinia graminis f. sp. tritici CRL 75-36-700-3]|uniref:Uncharacterized protein n=1 Tax=Puccinia graminis f. sp. tritici (strain CRL 75-36-700-3 / race SCCL) TaxID=418459 RepID=E3K6Q2_PUCGT|nr:uncharacterized protein PGTG_05397 [Puccinia graminis f. sp. tritici CRL 75-36-700-3]EFP80172.2 hypothetical protein PGTG_05397 [Puccinia graminis f. sp. tritici CRL 75-36-700-3]